MGTTRRARTTGPRLAVLSVIVAAGCSGGQATSGPSLVPTPSTTATATPGPTATPDEFDAVIEFAAGSLDPADSELGRLWADAFDTIEVDGQDPYLDPAAVRSYVSGEAPPTDCTVTQGSGRWRNNALWCPSDDVIAYDETWFRDMVDQFSYVAPVSILAHEWGHHVQSIVGVPARDIQVELQADCFSGLYLAATTLLGDREDDAALRTEAMVLAVTKWFELGDDFYPESEWTDPGLHGSGQQRIMATITGMLSYLGYGQADPSLVPGIPWCLGYGEFEGSDYVDIGPYALLVPPGRDGAWQGDAYGIAADERTTLETSDIALAWLPSLPLEGGATPEQMANLWTLAYPGLTPIEAIDISGNTPFDASVAYFYDNVATLPDDTVHEDSGVMALISPPGSVGGLLVVVSRGVPAPDEATPEALAQVEEQVAALYQVLNRLCSPSESATAPGNLDVACMRDLQ